MPPSRHPVASALLIAILTIILACLASGELLEVLAKTREQHREDMQDLTTSMKRLYLERLRALEKKAASVADYTLAESYRGEAERVRLELGDAAKAPLRLSLLPHDAEAEGKVTRTDGTPRTLSGWHSSARVTWRLPAVPKGGYAVTIVHGNNRAPVTATLSASHYFVSGPLQPVDAEHSAGVESSLGNLRIVEDAPALTLTIDGGGDVDIERILLVSHAP